MRRLLPVEIVEPPRRALWLLPHLLLGSFAAMSPIIDETSFSNPVFDSIFAWAPLTVWAIAFGIVALLAVYTLATRSYRTYRLCNVLFIGLCVMWEAALVTGRFVDGHTVTLLAFGLWGVPILIGILIAWWETPVILAEERRREWPNP